MPYSGTSGRLDMGDLLEEVEQFLSDCRKPKGVAPVIPIVILIIAAFLVWTYVLKK
jgi:hypothetical protein